MSQFIGLRILDTPELYTAGGLPVSDGATQFICLDSHGRLSFSTGTTDVSTADASAQIDLQSTTTGFLWNRLTTVQKDAISAPAAWVTLVDVTLGDLQFWDGVSKWITIASASGGDAWFTGGNTLTADGILGPRVGNFAVKFYAGAAERMRLFNTGELSIGNTTAGEVLEVVRNQAQFTAAKVRNSDAGGGARVVLAADVQAYDIAVFPSGGSPAGAFMIRDVTGASLDRVVITSGGLFGVNCTPTTTFQNNGSTSFTPMSIADGGAGVSSIGSAGSTVDVKTTFELAVTTANATRTIPNPSDTTASHTAIFRNKSTSLSVCVVGAGGGLGQVIPPGGEAIFVWDTTDSLWGPQTTQATWFFPFAAGSPRQTSYTANYGEFILTDPSGGSFSLTLPVISAASKGSKVAVSTVTNPAVGTATPANVLVTAGAANTIAGNANATLSGKSTIVLVSDGVSNWDVEVEPATPATVATLGATPQTLTRAGKVTRASAPATLGADSTYTFSNTGANAGDIYYLSIPTHDAHTVTVKNAATTTIATYANTVAGGGIFLFNGSAWEVLVAGNSTT